MIAIPHAVLVDVAARACAAFPHECCGYLVGPRGGDAVDELVACSNADPAAADGFAIDGAELFAFARSLRGERPARVVYHSHPNGRAYFSATDRARADEARYPVCHLVVGVTAAGASEAALFGEAPGCAELSRWPAAMLR